MLLNEITQDSLKKSLSRFTHSLLFWCRYKNDSLTCLNYLRTSWRFTINLNLVNADFNLFRKWSIQRWVIGIEGLIIRPYWTGYRIRQTSSKWSDNRNQNTKKIKQIAIKSFRRLLWIYAIAMFFLNDWRRRNFRTFKHG